MRATRILGWACLAGGLLAATPVHSGGIKVFDAVAQRTRGVQLARLVDQLANSTAQRALAQKQLEALTGSRGYGSLLLEGLAASLPEGDQELGAVYEGGGGGAAGSLARSLNAGRDLGGDGHGEGGDYHSSVTRAGNGAQALARVAYRDIVRDLAILRRLATSIDSARDPKAALELQARLMAQNVKSVLTTARMLALAEISRSQRRLESADRAARVRRMLEPRFVNPSLER